MGQALRIHADPSGFDSELLTTAFECDPQGIALAENGRIVHATNGSAAREVASNHKGSIDLRLAHIAMPGMGGRELGRRLRDTRPGMKTVYVSGFDPENSSCQEEGDPVVFFRKPLPVRPCSREYEKYSIHGAQRPFIKPFINERRESEKSHDDRGVDRACRPTDRGRKFLEPADHR